MSSSCLVDLVLQEHRAPRDGFSLPQLESILNEHCQSQLDNPVRLSPTSSPEYILAEEILFETQKSHFAPQCLIDIRARLQMRGSRLYEDASAALKIAAWEGCLQQIASKECDAAIPVKAILVIDPFRPYIVTRMARETLEGRLPILAPQLHAKYMQCFNAGLFLFKFEPQNILLYGDKIHFNDWTSACKREGPRKYKFVDSPTLLINYMNHFLIDLPEGSFIREIMTRVWQDSNEDIDAMIEYMSMLSFMSMYTAMGASAVTPSDALLAAVLKDISNAQAWDQQWAVTVAAVMDRFCADVLFEVYYQAIQVDVHVETETPDRLVA